MVVWWRRLAQWTMVLLLVLAIVGFVAVRWYEPGWRYEVRGVDVSHHQGVIDWEALGSDDVAFAYIKATEGGDWTDPRFAENWQAAGDAGVLRGAYHFFTLCRPGIDQAAHLIATVPGEDGMLPPAVDLEFGGNCSARPSVEDLGVELGRFLMAVEAHYGLTPVAYTTREFYDHYLDESPPEVTWWVRSAFWEPWGSPEWMFWQTWPGRRAGVEGDVDRNVFRGTLAELVSLTAAAR